MINRIRDALLELEDIDVSLIIGEGELEPSALAIIDEQFPLITEALNKMLMDLIEDHDRKSAKPKLTIIKR